MKRPISLLLATGLVFAVVMFTLVARLGPDAGTLAPTPSRATGKLIDVVAPRDELVEAQRAAAGVPQATGGDRTPIQSDESMATEPRDEIGERPFVELLVLEDRGQAGQAPISGLKIVATQLENPSGTAPLQVGTTDARGRLTATLPRTGWFVFRPDPGTQPSHIAALEPFGLSGQSGSPNANGVHRFAPGERAALTLTLPAAGELVVSVRDRDGRPVVKAQVLIELRSDLAERLGAPRQLGQARSHVTDELGLVTLSSVPQGAVVVHVLGPATTRSIRVSGREQEIQLRPGESLFHASAPEERRTLPAPRRVRVEAGRRTDVEVRIGTGEHELSGRVVDEDDAPVSGVQVSVQYAAQASTDIFGSEVAQPLAGAVEAIEVRTDSIGRFVAKGLDPGPYLLQVLNERKEESSGLRGSPVEHRIETDERTELHLDVGDLVLPRPRLFVVRGRVVLTAASRKGHKLDLTKVRPWLISLAGGDQRNWSYDSETGEFRTACALPAAPFQVRVGQWQGAQDYREYEFVPEAGVTLENVELRYP